MVHSMEVAILTESKMGIFTKWLKTRLLGSQLTQILAKLTHSLAKQSLQWHTECTCFIKTTNYITLGIPRTI